MYSQGSGDAIPQCTGMPTLSSSWLILPTDLLLFASHLEEPPGPLMSLLLVCIQPVVQ